MVKVYRIGFSPLGHDNTKDEKKKINIIFIHGLKGHPKKTWGRGSDADGLKTTNHGKKKANKGKKRSKGTKKPAPVPARSVFGRFRPSWPAGRSRKPSSSSPPPKPFWPYEFLVDEVPEARIWTYGYNANVTEGFLQACNQNSIPQHGQDLAVKFERDVENDDPVIFVAHSLGGIVVKDAIQRSEMCRNRTKLVVFLGTPHRGSRYAGWGGVVANLARYALQDPNTRLVEGLRVKSEVLDDIHQAFVDIVYESGIKVHSFYESNGLSGIKGFDAKIVDDFSSRLDLPPFIEKVESIAADHKQMTKFYGKSDPGYRAVSRVLKDFTHALMKADVSTGGPVAVAEATPVLVPAASVEAEPGSAVVGSGVVAELEAEDKKAEAAVPPDVEDDIAATKVAEAGEPGATVAEQHMPELEKVGVQAAETAESVDSEETEVVATKESVQEPGTAEAAQDMKAVETTERDELEAAVVEESVPEPEAEHAQDTEDSDITDTDETQTISSQESIVDSVATSTESPDKEPEAAKKTEQSLLIPAFAEGVN